jgi:hypothetical protein
MYRLLALKGELLTALNIAFPSGVDPNDNVRTPFQR